MTGTGVIVGLGRWLPDLHSGYGQPVISAPPRILWLSNETPDRDGQGGQRRQYYQVAALAKAGVEVTVVTLAGPQSDATVSTVARVYRTRPHMWRGLPSPRHRHLVRNLMAEHWDGVVVAHTESWPTWRPLLRRMRTTKVMVDMHNVLSAWHESQGRQREAQRWAMVESEIVAHGAAIAVCSDREASLLRVDAAPIVLPHGVDPDEWTAAQTPAHRRPVVKLFGNWGWAPNAAGLRWFMDEVWPRVDEHGVWTCQIAGSGVVGPLPSGVEAVGRVPSIREFLSDAAVVAVPVLDGVGAPVKFAEALASGAPVLATVAGAPYLGSLAAYVSDDATGWQEVLSDVQQRPRHYESVGRRARETVLRQGSWYAVSSPLLGWVRQQNLAP